MGVLIILCVYSDYYHFAEDQAVGRALKHHRSGLDFADALHLEASHACTAMLSFDGKLRTRAQLQPEIIAP